MLKHNLHYAEFYMTNVCNLACDNCNRYNNFAFAGHDRWADWANLYRQWSQRLNLIDIGIIGGEPLLNPDFPNWMHGVAELWPTSYIKIITNGTQFSRWPTLYQDLAQYQGQVVPYVTEHDTDRLEQTRQRLLEFMQEGTTQYDVYNDFLWRIRYQELRQPNWPECRTVQAFLNLPQDLQQQIGLDPKEFYQGPNTDPNSWQDRNGVRIVLTVTPDFAGSSVKHDPDTGTLRLRNSRPEDAIQVCPFKICHHFIRGRLYKCGPVGILPEFVQQFPVDMTDQEQQLLNSYQPAQADWSQQDLEQFVQGLKNADPIDQCRFCPDAVTILDGGPTRAYQKKIRIKAI
jgi:organic radical activating enzyme